jgi:hypothetical protein
MSSEPSRPWFRVPTLWAGLSIVTMWLSVLFIGVFGENIVSTTPGGTSTSVPVVVALIPFVLVATVVVARRGFRELAEAPDRSSDEHERAGSPAVSAKEAGQATSRTLRGPASISTP